MDLNAVRMFVHVVQAGSFSAAVQRAEVPLATLSRKIRELEYQLKVQLFDRSTRGVHLTEAGDRLYEFAIRGVEVLSDGEFAVKNDQVNLKGRLRLSIPPAFEPWWDILNSFQIRFPNIQLLVHSTERRMDLIEDGIDVALRIGSVANESLVARHIIDYRHILVASPALVDRLGWPRAPSDLARYPLATWISGIDARAEWRLGEEIYAPSAKLATNDYQHLRSRALAGDALTELPPFLAGPFISQGKLCRLLENHPLPLQRVNLLYSSQRHPSTIVRAYLDYCRQAIFRGVLTGASLE